MRNLAKNNLILPNNVIVFDRTQNTLTALANERLKQNDVKGAISIYLDIEKTGKYNVAIFSKIADLYAELGLYSNAIDYWFKYLDQTSSKHYVEAYNGLGGCFYLAGIYSHSVYYYNLQINNKYDSELPYDDYMYELFSEQEPKAPKIKLVDTEWESECEKVDEAKKIFYDDVDKSLELLNSIEKNSKEYEYAQGYAAMQYIVKDDYLQAIAAYKNVLSVNETSEFALNNLFALNFVLDNIEESEKYFNLIKRNSCADFLYLTKYFRLFFAKDMHEKGYIYSKKIFGLLPDLAINLVPLACAAYNSKRYEEAHRYFLEYYKICPSYLTEWYCKLACDAKDGKKVKLKFIDFNFYLPEIEVKRLEKLGEYYIECSTATLKRKSKQVLQFASAVFCTSRIDLQAMTCQILSYLKTKGAEKFLKSLLLRTYVRDNIKSMIVTILVEMGMNKTVGMVFGNVYLKVPFEKTEFNDINGDTFKFAYAIAFGKLAPLYEDLISNLRVSANELYVKLIENGNINKVTDPVALGAFIAIKSGIKINGSDDALIEYFGATKQSVNKINSLLNEDF